MKHAKHIRAAALAAAATLALSACSVLESDKIDYKSAGKGVSLEVPPDLTQLTDASRYAAPDGAVTASGYQAGQRAARAAGTPAATEQVADVQYHRNGNERWISVGRPASELWQPVRQFWQDNGFLLTIDQPELGIMETDWAENRAKLPQDIIRSTIGKVFDSLYSTGERDRFRTRMERNASGGTDIYVTHRGMEEVYNSSHKDSTVWQPRASDVELETEFLRRLMLRLGATQEQAQAAKAAAQAQEAQAASSGPALAALTQAGGQPVIQVGENFDRAWRAIGLALDRAGFTVEDRDRSKGAYYVRYAEPDAPRPKQGWLDRILNRSAAAIPTTQYQLIIQEQGGSSFVRALSESGAPLDAATAEKLLKLIAAEIK